MLRAWSPFGPPIGINPIMQPDVNEGASLNAGTPRNSAIVDDGGRGTVCVGETVQDLEFFTVSRKQ